MNIFLNIQHNIFSGLLVVLGFKRKKIHDFFYISQCNDEKLCNEYSLQMCLLLSILPVQEVLDFMFKSLQNMAFEKVSRSSGRVSTLSSLGRQSRALIQALTQQYLSFD